MYGPYDSTDPNKAHALNALVNKVVKAKIEGEESIDVWGSGVAIREWLYAEDFGRVIIETFDRDDNYLFSDPVNIGQNYGLSIRSILDIIIKEVGYKGNILWDRSMPDGAPTKVMDDLRFRKVFPDFEFTDLRKGVRETIKYYESLDSN
jgi:GDP-L-fucose synthase|tara:strand:- start:154 stop:600 length:447 start_codon:yes stop_codon:yes gene_type:complete